MKIPKNLVWNQHFQEKHILGCPGRKHERCNHGKSIGITVLFACQRRRAENWWNWGKLIKFMKFHENSGNLMVFNEIHGFLCVQPSATLHETLIFLRKKQGLKSLALQGARKTGIWVKFQKFHETSWSFTTFHKISWNSREILFWGARERIGALQPLKKHRNYLSFCMPALYGGFLVNSMKFTGNQEIPWKWRNFMKFMKFHEIHWFPGFRDPSRNLDIP